MSASGDGQLEVRGNGYTGAIALDANAMHIYHNSSSRDLILGTNETARLTIDGSSGNATFTGTITASGYNDSNWNTAYTHSQAAHAPTNAEQNVQSDWDATSGDALILNKPDLSVYSGYSFGASDLTFSGTDPGDIVWKDGDSNEVHRIWSGSNDYLTYRNDAGTAYELISAGSTSYNNTNWDTAYGWGDHGAAGYLTSFDITTQTDTKYLRSNADDTASGIVTLTKNTATGRY